MCKKKTHEYVFRSLDVITIPAASEEEAWEVLSYTLGATTDDELEGWTLDETDPLDLDKCWGK